MRSGRAAAALAAVVLAVPVLSACSGPPPAPAPGPAPVRGFWVDPDTEAARQAAQDPAFAPIATQPTALTLAGGEPELRALDRAVAGARSARRTLVLQVYAVPHRDAGSGFSAGGLPGPEQYLAYTRRVARALHGVPALLVLEPDALAQADRLPADEQEGRYALLAEAVEVYRAVAGLRVYLDGGNSGWTSPAEMAERLLRAGVTRARGFAVNVSNVHPTAEEARRAERISALTAGAHYVVDTSRNGPEAPARAAAVQRTAAPWCNPPGSRLGQRPTAVTGYPHADALLWVKHPGLSDGACGPGQPPAGAWYDAYARALLGLPAR